MTATDSVSPPGATSVIQASIVGGALPQQPATITGRFRRGRKLITAIASAVLVAAIFGFALPHFASYGSVWASCQLMTWPQALLIGVAAAASLTANWLVICSVLPSIRLREAAVVNLGSTAVANTLPAGGALGMGVSWAMLSGWGIGAPEYVLYTLVSGIWNVFVRIGLPVVALLVLLTVGRPEAGLVIGALAGLALVVVMAAGFGLLLRSESFAVRADSWLMSALTIAWRLARRKSPCPGAGSLLRFRDMAAGLLAARGWRITIATVASNLALWLVLLASLRGIGLSQAQVPWATSLAAFAFVRLITVLPVTPGGAGITEIGLVGILAAGADHGVTAQVAAAVLLYRAVTYLAPIPLGALACLAWRYTPTLIRRKPGPSGSQTGQPDAAEEPGEPPAAAAGVPAKVGSIA